LPSPPAPRWSLETRLVVAFIVIVALALGIGGFSAAVQLEGYFRDQERADVDGRASAASAVVVSRILAATADGGPIIDPSGVPSQAVETALAPPTGILGDVADLVAQGDVTVSLQRQATDGSFVDAGSFSAQHTSRTLAGQSRQDLTVGVASEVPDTWYARPGRATPLVRIGLTISDPFTFRDRSVQTVRGLLVLIGSLAFAIAGLFTLWLVRRLTRPVTRLTSAARALGEGDLEQHVVIDPSAPRELVELSEQFNTMAERLAESVRVIREDRDRSRDFLADVSHELRTPIAALRTYNELLREGADAEPDARREFLHSSAEQIDRLDWLATNLLELSKLDTGLVALDLRPNDLRGAAESAVEATEPAAQRKGVTLEAKLPGRPVRTRHDQRRVGQLLSNLLGNAVKFTPAGGHVTLSLERDTDSAILRVSDTGIGIDADELPRVFDRFYRGTGAAEARATGSGLGLAIVKSIVDMHRGVITIDSTPGRGTTVEVRLPRDPSAAPATGPTTPVEHDGTADATGGDPLEAARVSVADSSSRGGQR
jgi:signal transduction histidine kinase